MKYAGDKKSFVIPKQAFQKFRRDLIAQGVPVKPTIDGNGYEAKTKDDLLVLKAMRGNAGYLVTIVKDLLQ